LSKYRILLNVIKWTLLTVCKL